MHLARSKYAVTVLDLTILRLRLNRNKIETMETRFMLALFVWMVMLRGALTAPSLSSATNDVEESDVTADISQTKLEDEVKTISRSDVQQPAPIEILQPSSSINSRESKALRPFTLKTVNLNADLNQRQDKMLGYFAGYYPQQQMAQAMGGYPTMAPYFPPELYNDYLSQINEDEEISSRANRRRPPQSNSIENSPIFYIRLPPTPYMFVPGYGYISNPPSITPMSVAPMSQAIQHMSPYGHQHQQMHSQMQPQMHPQMHPQMNPYAPQPINPFINLPVNFVSNGKPTHVYQWNGAPAGYQPQPNPYQMGYPGAPVRQQQRPHFKPKPAYMQDSKITHLKGQYLFNGRPEEIYVLQNSYNSLGYNDHMRHYY